MLRICGVKSSLISKGEFRNPLALFTSQTWCPMKTGVNLYLLSSNVRTKTITICGYPPFKTRLPLIQLLFIKCPLNMHVNLHIHVLLYINAYKCICISAYRCTHLHMWIYICMYMYNICTWTSLDMWDLHMHVLMQGPRTCIYTYILVYVHLHIHYVYNIGQEYAYSTYPQWICKFA